MKEIEKLCFELRRGHITPEAYRLKLLALLIFLPDASMNIVAERLQYSVDGGDG